MATVRVPHESALAGPLFTAWPRHGDWRGALTAAGREVTDLARATKGVEPPHTADEPAAAGDVHILACDAQAEDEARAALGEDACVERMPYGDIWLRDTGPVFALDADGPIAVVARFNGWGGKFVYAGDEGLGEALARRLGLRIRRLDMIVEGGALEFDGEGTLITTRTCLLDRARNPTLCAADAEALFGAAFGAERVIWLDEGLANDHTDGHVDTLARFVAPGLVVCQAPTGRDEPNAAVLDAVARTLDGARDAGGRRIDVVRIPSPGLVCDQDGAPAPASHLNFVHAGERVVMPDFGTRPAAAAMMGLADLFPRRDVVALPARALLTGGGAFHCCTLQAPREGARL